MIQRDCGGIDSIVVHMDNSFHPEIVGISNLCRVINRSLEWTINHIDGY